MTQHASGVECLEDLTPYLWAGVVVFFGLGDLLTTLVGLPLERTIEVGPVAAAAYEAVGLWVLAPLKIAVLAGLVALYRAAPRPHRVGVPLGAACLGALITVWNIVIIVRAV